MKSRLLILGAAMAIACGGDSTQRTVSGSASTTAATHVGSIAAADESHDWVRAAKDYASTRYSSLDQITPDSVKQLGVKVTFATGASAGHEAAPLVVNDTMYIVTPWPNVSTRST
jgi:glucose dehydrogenase